MGEAASQSVQIWHWIYSFFCFKFPFEAGVSIICFIASSCFVRDTGLIDFFFFLLTNEKIIIDQEKTKQEPNSATRLSKLIGLFWLFVLAYNWIENG